MAREFSAEQSFAAPCEQVFAMLSDPAYLAWLCSHTGGHDVHVSSDPTDDGGAVLVLNRTLPAKVPSFAKPFLGETIEVDERHTWGPPAQDGSRDGTFTATFGGAPASVAGTMRLEPSGDGVRRLISGEAKASVPLVGGKVEELVRDQLMRLVNKEQQVGSDWLAGERG
jgi:uncharacterized protein YndB with AHSA1/START domain